MTALRPMSKPLIPLSKLWQRAWAFGQHIVGGAIERMNGIPCVNISRIGPALRLVNNGRTRRRTRRKEAGGWIDWKFR